MIGVNFHCLIEKQRENFQQRLFVYFWHAMMFIAFKRKIHWFQLSLHGRGLFTLWLRGIVILIRWMQHVALFNSWFYSRTSVIILKYFIRYSCNLQINKVTQWPLSAQIGLGNCQLVKRFIKKIKKKKNWILFLVNKEFLDWF